MFDLNTTLKNLKKVSNTDLLETILNYALMDRLTNNELRGLRKLREEKQKRNLKHNNSQLNLLKNKLQRNVARLKVIKEEAVMLGSYTGYRFQGKKSKKLKNISGKEFKLSPGIVFCVRPNSNKKGHYRMVVPQFGESNLFNLDDKVTRNILNKSSNYTGNVKDLFTKFNKLNNDHGTVPLTNKQKYILLVSGFSEGRKPKLFKGYSKVTSLKKESKASGNDFIYYKVLDKVSKEEAVKERNQLKAKINPLLAKQGIKKYTISVWDCKSKSSLYKSQSKFATKHERLSLNLSTLERLGII